MCPFNLIQLKNCTKKQKRRNEKKMAHMVDLLIDFLILVIAAVIGFGIFYATSTSGWDETVVAIWGYIPLIFIAVGCIALIVKVKTTGK
jgi:Na+/serine symporter